MQTERRSRMGQGEAVTAQYRLKVRGGIVLG
jgi:hypothetical protein